MARCNCASYCRMDCPSAHRGSGWDLWRRLNPACPRDGHPGSRDHRGKMDIRRGSSAQFGGIALIMSWCSASGTFVTCWDCTKDITMTLARTYRQTRMHLRRVLFRPRGASWPIADGAGFVPLCADFVPWNFRQRLVISRGQRTAPNYLDLRVFLLHGLARNRKQWKRPPKRPNHLTSFWKVGCGDRI